MTSTRLDTGLKAIAGLARLKPNWDGYGSPAVQSAALQAAARVLSALDAESPHAPQICPVAGGGIAIEWHVGTRELELEILPDGSVVFLTVVNGEPIEEGRLVLDQFNSARWIVLRDPDRG